MRKIAVTRQDIETDPMLRALGCKPGDVLERHESPAPAAVRRCPHCGNTDRAFIEDNGEPPTSRDLTLLCLARVKPEAWSFDHREPAAEDIGPDGLVACGMQWDANADRY
jgi:hypothetical protein